MNVGMWSISTSVEHGYKMGFNFLVYINPNKTHILTTPSGCGYGFCLTIPNGYGY